MNVVDSSGWIEYLTGGSNAGFFEPVIHDAAELIVPSISIYEVLKVLLRDYVGERALERVSQMSRGQIVPLNRELSIAAAYLSLELRLPMADSVILATAQMHDAVLWTQDADFEGIAGVRYVGKA